MKVPTIDTLTLESLEIWTMAGSKDHPKISINMELLRSFTPSKSFKPSGMTSHITTMDWDDTGTHLVTSCSDDTLRFYDAMTGKETRAIQSKKYGVHLAKFTHKTTNVVYASTKGEKDALRYMSVHDEVFIRYFEGHTGRVNSIELCPISDTFISCAYDKTLRLWDLRSSSPQGLLNIPAPSFCAFDPTGLCFGVATYSLNAIQLYDIRSFDKEPFAVFSIKDDNFLGSLSYPPALPEWKGFEFSNDGLNILVVGKQNVHYVLDAYEGNIKGRCVGVKGFDDHHGNIMDSTSAVFSPDGRYVVSGSSNDTLLIYDTQRASSDMILEPAAQIETKLVDKPRQISFNPRHALLASADKNMTLWLPEM